MDDGRARQAIAQPRSTEEKQKQKYTQKIDRRWPCAIRRAHGANVVYYSLIPFGRFFLSLTSFVFFRAWESGHSHDWRRDRTISVASSSIRVQTMKATSIHYLDENCARSQQTPHLGSAHKRTVRLALALAPAIRVVNDQILNHFLIRKITCNRWWLTGMGHTDTRTRQSDMNYSWKYYGRCLSFAPGLTFLMLFVIPYICCQHGGFLCVLLVKVFGRLFRL